MIIQFQLCQLCHQNRIFDDIIVYFRIRWKENSSEIHTHGIYRSVKLFLQPIKLRKISVMMRSWNYTPMNNNRSRCVTLNRPQRQMLSLIDRRNVRLTSGHAAETTVLLNVMTKHVGLGLFFADLHQNFTNNEQKRCKNKV